MHPIFFRIGGLTVHTYGLFVAMGFLMGMALALREARQRNVDPEMIANLFFWIIVSAIVGSRLLYVAIEFRSFVSAPLDILKVWKGGLVFYGGLIAAAIVTLFLIRRHKMHLGTTLDILAPSLAVGQVFGRLGCFSAGCCYGRPADVPWAVTFTNPDSLAPLHLPLHPTQLYEAGAMLVVFFILYGLRHAKQLTGRLMWLYLILYSGVRFLIENYRGDPRGSVLEGVLSTSQLISLALALVGVVAFLLFRSRDLPDNR